MIIKNGKVALTGEPDYQMVDIRVENGLIAEIGPNLPVQGDVVDAADHWVLPGGIDPHVHFYDPGYTAKEDFAHGSAAAASGGVTCVVDMPCTSIPPITAISDLHHKNKIVGAKAVIDYGLFGGVSKQLFDAGYEEAMESLADDVLAYKCYAISGMETWGALDHFRFRKVLETAKRLGVTILLHAEDAEYVNNATEFYESVGKAPEHWHAARPELAEVLAVHAALRINDEVGSDLHIVHIGAAEAAEMLRGRSAMDRAPGAARATGETCPQYLAFALKDFLEQGPALKIAPPIKEDGNRQRLWELLADGTVAFVASDHAPGTKAEKEPGDIWCNSAGIAGVGTILPYVFSEGHLAGKLTLPQYLAAMSENAAKRYRLWDRKGSLEVGKHADIVLMDSNVDFTVRAADFLSKGKISPFEGMTFRGRVAKTIVRGTVVYEHGRGIVVDGGYGEHQKPRRN